MSKHSIITTNTYSMFKELILFDVYYYDDMILKVPQINTDIYFDRAEVEHITNHTHLEEYIEYQNFSRNDLSDIAKLLFFRLKALYPDKKTVHYASLQEVLHDRHIFPNPVLLSYHYT